MGYVKRLSYLIPQTVDNLTFCQIVPKKGTRLMRRLQPVPLFFRKNKTQPELGWLDMVTGLASTLNRAL